MRVAYYRPENSVQLVHRRSPMRSALDIAGVEVVDVTEREGGGSASRNAAAIVGLAGQLCDRFRHGPGIDIWITEGPGPEAPDAVSPIVSRELAVPLLVLEPDPLFVKRDLQDGASDMAKRATHIVTTSSATARVIEESSPVSAGLTLMSAFIDTNPFRAAHKIRDLHRARFASSLRLPGSSPWLLTDGKTADGDSLRSYEMLALSLSRLALMDWQLIIVGDGRTRRDATKALLRLPLERIRCLEEMTQPDFAALAVSCNLFVWPAIGESAPASLLEAQASGLPVIAGSTDSTIDRVIDGRTGRLTPDGNAESFANAISFLLRHPDFMQSFSETARETVHTQHGLEMASNRLGEILADLA